MEKMYCQQTCLARKKSLFRDKMIEVRNLDLHEERKSVRENVI